MDLYQVVEVGSDGIQRRFQVFEYLFGLGMEVSWSNQLKGWIKRHLPGDIDGSPAGNLDNVGKTRWRK